MSLLWYLIVFRIPYFLKVINYEIKGYIKFHLFIIRINTNISCFIFIIYILSSLIVIKRLFVSKKINSIASQGQQICQTIDSIAF